MNDKTLDSSGLPAVGTKRSYIVCGKCDAWFHSYGVVTAYCSCGNRSHKQALKAAVAACAVIAGAGAAKPTFKEALAAGAPWKEDGAHDGPPTTRVKPGAGPGPEPAAERGVPWIRIHAPPSQPGQPAFTPTPQQVQVWVSELQEKGVIECSAPIVVAKRPTEQSLGWRFGCFLPVFSIKAESPAEPSGGPAAAGQNGTAALTALGALDRLWGCSGCAGNGGTPRQRLWSGSGARVERLCSEGVERRWSNSGNSSKFLALAGAIEPARNRAGASELERALEPARAADLAAQFNWRTRASTCKR